VHQANSLISPHSFRTISSFPLTQGSEQDPFLKIINLKSDRRISNHITCKVLIKHYISMT